MTDEVSLNSTKKIKQGRTLILVTIYVGLIIIISTTIIDFVIFDGRSFTSHFSQLLIFLALMTLVYQGYNAARMIMILVLGFIGVFAIIYGVFSVTKVLLSMILILIGILYLMLTLMLFVKPVKLFMEEQKEKRKSNKRNTIFWMLII